MDIRFFPTKYSDSIIPVITTLISYHEPSGVLIFEGTYEVPKLPQKLVMIVENYQYPMLIEVIKILHHDNSTFVLLTKKIEDITSEQELSAWCLPS